MLLHASGSAKLPKDPSLMMPSDFLKISELVPIYKGKLKNCKIEPKNIMINSI
jgi:hypothetical protein